MKIGHTFANSKEIVRDVPILVWKRKWLKQLNHKVWMAALLAKAEESGKCRMRGLHQDSRFTQEPFAECRISSRQQLQSRSRRKFPVLNAIHLAATATTNEGANTPIADCLAGRVKRWRDNGFMLPQKVLYHGAFSQPRHPLPPIVRQSLASSRSCGSSLDLRHSVRHQRSWRRHRAFRCSLPFGQISASSDSGRNHPTTPARALSHRLILASPPLLHPILKEIWTAPPYRLASPRHGIAAFCKREEPSCERFRQVISEMACLIRGIPIGRKLVDKRNQGLLDNVIRIQPWKMQRKERLHHRPIAGIKHVPSRVPGVHNVPKERHGCVWHMRCSQFSVLFPRYRNDTLPAQKKRKWRISNHHVLQEVSPNTNTKT